MEGKSKCSDIFIKLFICCSFLGVMPAYCYSSNCLGTKVLTLYTDNQRKGIPNIQAIVVQMDPSTGSVIAVRTNKYKCY